jgi:hypothetical protein
MFTKPWRQDHMNKRHMLEQHQEKAKEYLSLPAFIEKASYFDLLATSSKGKGVDVGALEKKFIDMKGLLGQNARIKALVENENENKSTTPFAEAWAPFYDDKCGLLKRFFGGLASVFPGTATVECNFLLTNWEKDDYRVFYTANSTLNCLKWLTRCSLIKKKKAS